MINRRDLIIGGACLAAAASAEAMRPRNRMSLIGKAKLEDAIPKRFGGWSARDAEGLVTPQSENSLAAKLYSQSVGRIYVGPDDVPVMMLIAYGDTQSDTLQLHRPEVCYPAFGFTVTESFATRFALGGGASVPGRNLTATSPGRDEHISYWTRIGEYLPVDNGEQRRMKLMTALGGFIPDGVLVRISNILGDRDDSFALNQRFAADLVRGLAPALRPALVTTDVARRVAGAGRSA